jgi:hypothetical protein
VLLPTGLASAAFLSPLVILFGPGKGVSRSLEDRPDRQVAYPMVPRSSPALATRHLPLGEFEAGRQSLSSRLEKKHPGP